MTTPTIKALPLMSPSFSKVFTSEMLAAYEKFANDFIQKHGEEFKPNLRRDLDIIKKTNLLPEFEFLKKASQEDLREYLSIKVKFFKKYPPARSSLSGYFLLSLYKSSLEECKEESSYGEKALFSLLSANINNESIGPFDFNQDAAGEIFHKQFRQVDITEIAGVDAAIWNLLSDAPIFWSTLEKGNVVDWLD